MNLREAVLCQRLRARSRGELHPASEEDVRAVEERLGFPLPSMLRAFYLHVNNGWGTLGIYSVPSSQQGPSSDPSIRDHQLGGRLFQEEPGLAPPSDAPAAPASADTAVNPAPNWAYLEGLRRHPGAYCSWGEDGFPEELPDHWVYLARGNGSLWVLFDGDTGSLYYHEAEMYYSGKSWTHVSFCAPSVEDWMERELDASWVVRMRYHPHRKLTDVLDDGKPGAIIPSLAPVVEDYMKARRAFYATRRLRLENLRDEGPDPVEEEALSGIRYAGTTTLQIRHVSWKLEQARHQVLRQLYRLMEIFESATDANDNNQREDWSKALAPEALGGLIEADAQLAPITQTPLGISPLYRLAETR